jgi:polypeptide N-acetylgalactosaminyltransferase
MACRRRRRCLLASVACGSVCLLVPPFVLLPSEFMGRSSLASTFVVAARRRRRKLHGDPINVSHGYTTGPSCWQRPTNLPPESRPRACASTDAASAASDLRASIIVITHNEAGCALRRTLLSVLSPARTAASLLGEVVVMDDASSQPARETIADPGLALDGRIRWLRSESRLGVARARTAAARTAAFPVLCFLDAHCEPQAGWLAPLVTLLAGSPHAVALPVIEPIEPHSFTYVPGPRPEHPPRGVIADWNLTFGWDPLSEAEMAAREARAPSFGGRGLEPVRSPAMAGGVFAMRREWFFGSGGYDPGLEVWGVENVEMALRVWMCGGELLTLPCSRVGHVFRSAQPFTWPNGSGALTVRRNAWRVAAVWMDEVADAVGLGIDAKARAALHGAPGLDDRHALRRRLRCKTFRWYLEEIFPQHPPLPAGFRWSTPGSTRPQRS